MRELLHWLKILAGVTLFHFVGSRKRKEELLRELSVRCYFADILF